MATNQRLLEKRSELQMKSEALLKSRDAGGSLRSLEDAEQRLSDVPVNLAANKTLSGGTPPREDPEFDGKRKEQEAEELDDDQEPRLGAR